jgi:hypothetical protein
MGDSLLANGATLCQACCEKAGGQAADPASFKPVRQTDPTLCQRCGRDTPATLPTVAGFSLCPACEALVRDYPFPKWAKLAAVALAVLVGAAAVWNMRYVQAYREMRASLRALSAGDMALADQQAHRAFERVPESADLTGLVAFFDGIRCLSAERYDEAAYRFKKADDVLPAVFGTKKLIVQAQTGEAFVKKDFDTYLDLATKASKKWPEDPAWKTAIASAQACKYAATGTPLFREQALLTFQQARALAPQDDAGLAEYEQRLQHRLETREIISRQEFLRRFPNGWNKDKEAAQ